MDDLLGEDWQSTSSNSNRATQSLASNYSSLRPSPQPPASSSSTPLNLSRPSSTVTGGVARPASSTPKPAADAFGGLIGGRVGKGTSNGSLTIQERQRQLIEERQRQQQEQSKLWDNLGSSKAKTVLQPAQDDEDDILAAFNKDAKVDNASYYPPPTSGTGTPLSNGAKQENTSLDDDDTFGLKDLSTKHRDSSVPAIPSNDDDILGELGRPVVAKPARPEADSSDSDDGWNENVASSRSRQAAITPQDGPLAELVEMGFPVDSAKMALQHNDGDAQRAVGWLLQQAHEESKQKMREQQGVDTEPRSRPQPSRGRDNASPARRADSNARAAGEKDASQIAQEFGSKLFKSANSLWKASQKQMAKTMADFQQERDPNQPKWMQSSSTDSSREPSQRPAAKANGHARAAATNVTNEAALLDMPRTEVPARSSKAPVTDGAGARHSRDDDLTLRPRSTTPVTATFKPAAKLTRQAVEEQSAEAYVSPARRRKAAPKPQPEPEVDLFSPEPIKKVTPQSRPAPAQSPRPAAPARSIPPVATSALASSAAHRQRGTEAFKRGDYAVAHEAYTAALTPLPATHPIVILVLSNRALTALKTGDAKTAVSDADRALDLIGPSLGNGEIIEAEGDSKDMREFYGKALMRKAEALEHLEKWQDAGLVWRLAVEGGLGGSIAIQGKARCDRALAPKPVARPAAKTAPAKRPVKQAAAAAATSLTDAVRKLREANAAAEKADDEKFQLADQVEARLTTWKDGKADNLRALLQSLDTVLWSSAGWKKVGMSDLVIPGKVKIVYMKAIAKVHPDKIAQTASTEERMISGAVFSTLNEAWDKFKKDNNL